MIDTVNQEDREHGDRRQNHYWETRQRYDRRNSENAKHGNEGRFDFTLDSLHAADYRGLQLCIA